MSPAQRDRLAGLVSYSRPRNQEPHDFNLDNFVSFDSEDEWDQQARRAPPGSSSSSVSKPFVSQLFSAVGMVVDRLTDLAFTFVPQGVSVRVVRTAVTGGLLLLLLSFAKSVLGFILTLGSLVLGAYVAVRILGIDLGGMVTDEPEEFKRAASKRRGPSRQEPRGRQSEFKGLLGGSSSVDEDGLLDVWFERSKDKSGKGKPSRRPRK
ncbi:hypothetical protein N2152v2_002845 [Parachlorella kessleri]